MNMMITVVLANMNKIIMSNFQFLQEEWSSLYRKVILAEQRVFKGELV